MNKTQTAALGIVAAYLLTASIAAQNRVATNRPEIYGFGIRSCGAFNATAPESAERVHYVSWLGGYISGAGTVFAALKLPFTTTDMHAIEAWVSKDCGDHPLDSVADSAGRLLVELRARATVR